MRGEARAAAMFAAYASTASGGEPLQRAAAPVLSDTGARFRVPVNARASGYARQYSHVYCHRLAQMRGMLRAAALKRWGDTGACAAHCSAH